MSKFDPESILQNHRQSKSFNKSFTSNQTNESMQLKTVQNLNLPDKQQMIRIEKIEKDNENLKLILEEMKKEKKQIIKYLEAKDQEIKRQSTYVNTLESQISEQQIREQELQQENYNLRHNLQEKEYTQINIRGVEKVPLTKADSQQNQMNNESGFDLGFRLETFGQDHDSPKFNSQQSVINNGKAKKKIQKRININEKSIFEDICIAYKKVNGSSEKCPKFSINLKNL